MKLKAGRKQIDALNGIIRRLYVEQKLGARAIHGYIAQVCEDVNVEVPISLSTVQNRINEIRKEMDEDELSD